MTNFTKGEWVFNNEDKYYDGCRITSECRVGMVEVCKRDSAYFDGEDLNSYEVEQNANAHLIKTSPKMYNLLHKIMLDHCNDSVLYTEIDELLEEARGEV